jgi:hypothetical protein
MVAVAELIAECDRRTLDWLRSGTPVPISMLDVVDTMAAGQGKGLVNWRRDQAQGWGDIREDQHEADHHRR